MEPWEDQNSCWPSKESFFKYLRNSFRRIWMHYPVSRKFKDSQCVPNFEGSGNPRAKSVGQCRKCRAWFAKSHLVIDHIDPARGFNEWEEASRFVQRLFTTSDNMRLLCRPCHDLISAMDKFGLDEKGVVARKEAIRFSKLIPANQVQILIDLECPADFLSNASKRRSAYEHHLLHQRFPDGPAAEGGGQAG